MSEPQLLGQLSALHQMMEHLVGSIPAEEVNNSFEPEMAPIAWLYGRAAYLECYWLREVILGDDDLTSRVRHLFGHGVVPNLSLYAQLPPLEHLMNWALEIQDHNLTLLANPKQLPDHPLLSEGRLLPRLLIEQGELCEAIIIQLSARRLVGQPGYRVENPLQVLPPSTDHADVHQGHYRVGARHEDPSARDDELPPNVVELHAFRIDMHTVSNGAFLGFIEAGGYEEAGLWDEAGRTWLAANPHRPHHWRRDLAGNWYGIGLNGPYDLLAEDGITGLSHHEAEAYANWVASQGGELAGAVVQHEYQWEVAVRAKAFADYGRVWEWCSNSYHPYTGYKPPVDVEAASNFIDSDYALRGGCLHSQVQQRRSSHRHHAPAGQRFRFSGTRLVFPPSKMPWQ